MRPIGDWSMAISLSRCSSPSIRSCSPGSPTPPFRSRFKASARMSLTSELFPGAADTGDADERAERDFDRDVFEVVVPGADDPQFSPRLCRGVCGGRRCFVSASGPSAESAASASDGVADRSTRRFVGISIRRWPVKNWPVTLLGALAISSSEPIATTSPPRTPGPGPKSTIVSAARIVSSSCSTTTTVLPLSRS